MPAGWSPPDRGSPPPPAAPPGLRRIAPQPAPLDVLPDRARHTDPPAGAVEHRRHRPRARVVARADVATRRSSLGRTCAGTRRPAASRAPFSWSIWAAALRAEARPSGAPSTSANGGGTSRSPPRRRATPGRRTRTSSPGQGAGRTSSSNGEVGASAPIRNRETTTGWPSTSCWPGTQAAMASGPSSAAMCRSAAARRRSDIHCAEPRQLVREQVPPPARQSRRDRLRARCSRSTSSSTTVEGTGRLTNSAPLARSSVSSTSARGASRPLVCGRRSHPLVGGGVSTYVGCHPRRGTAPRGRTHATAGPSPPLRWQLTYVHPPILRAKQRRPRWRFPPPVRDLSRSSA
jgi:hypothetical protein